jgi:hypothetical protein
MDIITKFVAPAALFLLTLVFGFWLSRLGKPYNGPLFNIHKLLALAAVIVTALQILGALKIVEAQPILIALQILIGLCAAALFVTGALMSANKPAHDRLLTIHKIAMLLAVIAALGTLYLLGGRT